MRVRAKRVTPGPGKVWVRAKRVTEVIVEYLNLTCKFGNSDRICPLGQIVQEHSVYDKSV